MGEYLALLLGRLLLRGVPGRVAMVTPLVVMLLRGEFPVVELFLSPCFFANVDAEFTHHCQCGLNKFFNFILFFILVMLYFTPMLRVATERAKKNHDFFNQIFYQNRFKNT